MDKHKAGTLVLYFGLPSFVFPHILRFFFEVGGGECYTTVFY